MTTGSHFHAWPSLFQFGLGVALLWLSLRSAPLRARGGALWPYQHFGKMCFLLLGLAMVVLSLWGLFLERH